MYDNLLDYFGRSFRLLFKQPILLLPILIEIGIGILFALAFGLPLLTGIIRTSSLSFGSNLALISIAAIVFGILGLAVRGGLLYMIKQVTLYDKTDFDDFLTGMKKYFGRIFLGTILVAIVMLVVGLALAMISMVFSILGPLVWLWIIVVIVGMAAFMTFLALWQTILVYEDCDVFEAINLSFKFGKEHFWLIFVVTIIKQFLTGTNTGNNNPNQNSIGTNQMNLLNFTKMLQIAFVPLIIVLAILAIFLELIFDIVFFAIYHDRRRSIV